MTRSSRGTRISPRSIAVILVAIVCLLGLFALMRSTDQEPSSIEPTRVQAPAKPAEHVVLEPPTDSTPAVDTVRVASSPVETSHAAQSPAPQSTSSQSPAKPISIRVRLVDASGALITHGRPDVSAWTADGVQWSSQELEPGVHALRGLPPGTWRVHVAVIGFEEVQRDVNVPAIDAGVQVDVILTALRGVLIALLTPLGEPYPLRAFPRPDVIATSARPGELIRDELGASGKGSCGKLVHANDAGLDARYLGKLVPRCELPLWVSLLVGGQVLESTRLDRGTEELSFTLDPARFDAMLANVRLRVVDVETREPLTDAIVELTSGPSSSAVAISAAGVVEYASVVPGIAHLRILLDGYEYTPSEFVVAPGAHVDLGDVPLSKVGVGEVRIRCEAPERVDSFLTIWGRSTDVRADGALSTSMSKKTHADEPVVLELSRGDWRVWCESQQELRKYRSRPVDIAMNGESFELVMRLELVAELTLTPGLGERTVTITDVTEGRASPSTHVVGSRPVLLELTVGRWEVVVHGPDGESSVTVDLGPNGARVELE